MGGYDFYSRVEELQELAFLDESADWETDYFGIYYDFKNEKFSFISACGCSCWGGEYEEIQTNSLFSLLDEVKNHENVCILPSEFGKNWLFEEAEKTWNDIKDSI
jgi:hypothetical protein